MNRKTRYLSPLMLATSLILTGVVTASARPAPQTDADDSNISRAEVGLLDRFFDTHPAIAQALAKDPSLIDNPQYVASQPALQAFLQDHPAIREQLRTNPQAVLKDVVRFNDYTNRYELTRSQMETLETFMNSHPELAKQLEANPRLIDNPDFLKNNPDLVAFLNSHPDLAEDWRTHPEAAMKGLAALEAQGKPPAKTGPTGTGSTGPHSPTSPSGTDLLSHDQAEDLADFMNAHPEIASQMEAKPSLINDIDYLSHHPELVTFLRYHPDIWDDWSGNPEGAIKSVAAIDGTPVKPPVSTGSTGKPQPIGPAPARTDLLSRAQAEDLAGFMAAHPDVASQIEKDPGLINDIDYLSHQPELVIFLRNHPDIWDDWSANPQAAMKTLAALNATPPKPPTSTGPTGTDQLSRGQVETLDSFMNAHPMLADQLQSNPSLINNQAFVNDHPELVAFLQSHPDLAKDWRSDPQVAMNDVARFNAVPPKSGSTGVTRPAVAAFDAFLNSHATIAEELRAHPELITESAYIKANPELSAFLASNPTVAEEIATNPALFMRDAQKLDTHDITTAAKQGAEVRGATTVQH